MNNGARKNSLSGKGFKSDDLPLMKPGATFPDKFAMMTTEDDKRIVVLGVDGSGRSEHAFEWYSEHLHRPENYIIIVHSVEVHSAHVFPNVFDGPEMLKNELERQRQNAKDIEQKYMNKLKEKNMEGRVDLLGGKPGEVIVRTAKDEGAEMVVVGTRGTGKLRRTIMGSVSDYVVHHCGCPVITVRRGCPIRHTSGSSVGSINE